MGESILLDGHDLNGIDREGSWKVSHLEGWWTRPAVKDQPRSRVHRDGSNPVPIVYDERLITIRGRVSSRSHAYLHEALATISSLAYRGEADLIVGGHGPLQTARVDPRGEVSATLHTDSYVSYVIPLVAPDPFKYGGRHSVQVTVGNPGSLRHDGTAEAWPTVTVAGSMGSGYTLNIGGVQVAVTVPLVSGASHVIDMKRRRLRVGGTWVYGALNANQFPHVPPGARPAFSITGSGTGTATAVFYDTFI